MSPVLTEPSNRSWELTLEENGAGVSVDVDHGPQRPADVHPLEDHHVFAVFDLQDDLSSRRDPDLQLGAWPAFGVGHSSGPVARFLGQVGYGHGREGQASGCRVHVGEAHAQPSVPARGRLQHLQMDLLPDPHRAATEHQAVLEGGVGPGGQSAVPTQAHLVSKDLGVEGQGAETGASTAVGRRGSNVCNDTQIHSEKCWDVCESLWEFSP